MGVSSGWPKARRAVGALAFVAVTGCATMQLRPAVDLSVSYPKGTPGDAALFVDEQYVAPLSVVREHKIRLPEGRHVVTVEKAGYFPWDAVVDAGVEPVHLDVRLRRIPD
jgi:hypothetical protein